MGSGESGERMWVGVDRFLAEKAINWVTPPIVLNVRREHIHPHVSDETLGHGLCNLTWLENFAAQCRPDSGNFPGLEQKTERASCHRTRTTA